VAAVQHELSRYCAHFAPGANSVALATLLCQYCTWHTSQFSSPAISVSMASCGGGEHKGRVSESGGAKIGSYRVRGAESTTGAREREATERDQIDPYPCAGERSRQGADIGTLP
jgi:hypothetical protein